MESALLCLIFMLCIHFKTLSLCLANLLSLSFFPLTKVVSSPQLEFLIEGNKWYFWLVAGWIPIKACRRSQIMCFPFSLSSFLSEEWGCFTLGLECFPQILSFEQNNRKSTCDYFFFFKKNRREVSFCNQGFSGIFPVAKAGFILMEIFLPQSTETTGMSHCTQVWL